MSAHDAEHSSVIECPALSEIGTLDGSLTRFHACERRWKCPYVRADGTGCFDTAQITPRWRERYKAELADEQMLRDKGKSPHVVFVNFAEATHFGWNSYRSRLETDCEKASRGLQSWPDSFLVPLARHSTLPELQELVGLFKPRTIYPNTIYPEANGYDYASLPELFGTRLADGGRAQLQAQADAYCATLRAGPSRTVATQVNEDEEGESQEAREEAVGRFASMASRLGVTFIRDNFEHFSDKEGDIDLLMATETETAPTERTEARHTRSPSKVKSEEAATPAPPHQRDEAAVVTDGFLSGQAFYFTSSARNEETHLRAWSAKIECAGGVVIPAGRTAASQRTAIQLAMWIVCRDRSDEEYETVSEHVGLCDERTDASMQQAASMRKDVGNFAWLTHVFEHEQLLQPRTRLQWWPRPTQPIAGADQIVRPISSQYIISD